MTFYTWNKNKITRIKFINRNVNVKILYKIKYEEVNNELLF